VKILAVEWRTALLTVGFVAIETRLGNWKAYVGPAANGGSLDADAQFVAMHGAKLEEHEARAFFPQFADKGYGDPE
jgi:hypothetical protein